MTPKKFKDKDVLVHNCMGLIGMVEGNSNDGFFKCYAWVDLKSIVPYVCIEDYINWKVQDWRLATKEEKDKFYNEIERLKIKTELDLKRITMLQEVFKIN